MKPALKTSAYLLLALTLVGLRIYHLDCDPPTWLSWSSGIYSDEGIYAGDAASAALTGHWSPGDFHSAEIAPLHHLALLTLFRAFGVSLVTARTLSVVCSFVCLVFFWLILRREFDEITAAIGVVFLGLSPVFLFYNRLALLETPAVALLLLAVYLADSPKLRALSGPIAALAVIYKPLVFLCLPAMLRGRARDPDRRAVSVQAAGFVAALAVYYFCWQYPHHADLARYNGYYVLHQYLPHSARASWHNIVRALWSGSSDGVLVYLMHFAPIELILLLTLAGSPAGFTNPKLKKYWLWFAVPALVFCLLSYAPSRYFILFSPALAALAAVAVQQMIPKRRTLVVGVFVLWSALWIGVSLIFATNDVQKAGAILENRLPPGTDLVGQYGPEMALITHEPSVYVQPGLANEKLDIGSGAVLVTRSTYWDNCWQKRLGKNPAEASEFILKLPRRQVVDVVAVPSQR